SHARERERLALDALAEVQRRVQVLADQLCGLRRPPVDGSALVRMRRAQELARQANLLLRETQSALSLRRSAQATLASQLHELVDLAAVQAGLAVDLRVKGRIPRLRVDVEQTLTRVAQRALTMARQDGADAVRLRLHAADSEVTLTLSDTGRFGYRD